MRPTILLQFFRRHRPWLTLRGWALASGLIAAGLLLFTFVFHWR